MGAYSSGQIELEADLLDFQARIGVKGALGGWSARADHQAAQGSDHRPVIGAEGRAWNTELDACLFAAFGGHSAKARVGGNSACDHE